MYNLQLIEDSYKKFMKNLFHWIPDGIYFINLKLLHHFDLLHFQPGGINRGERNSNLNPDFKMIESPEKMTLVSNEFIVWIIPDQTSHPSQTYTLIALNPRGQEPQLEAAFIATGIYNNSNLVIKVLEKFLNEIRETESILSKFRKAEKK